MHRIEIRRVERSDIDSCYMLEKLCYDEFEVAPRDFIEKRIEIYPDGFYVAEVDGVVVGMVNSGATHRDDVTDEGLKYLVGHVRNGCNGVVFSLAVHPDYRGRGIGRQLVERIIEVAEQKQKQRLLLVCRKSLIGFYESIGFSCSGPSSARFGDRLHFQMEYALTGPVWPPMSHHDSAALPW